MRKVSFAIILVFLALYLQSSATVWIGYFALQEEIAKHCENKSNADCAGKCQVQKIETETHANALVQVSIPDVSEFLPKKNSSVFFTDANVRSFFIFSERSLPHGYDTEVFRPPISA